MNLKLHNEVDLCKKDGVSTITLRRAPFNILDIAFMRQIDEVLRDPATVSGAALLALRAEGKAFCAGVDVADHTPERTEEMLAVFHGLIARLQDLPIPTLALVEGSALGGGFELALSCDMIVASDKAKFAVPEITLGVFPPVAIVELPALIGIKKAMELILSGRTITALEAEQMGLINAVYAVDVFAEKSQEYMSRFTKLSHSSLALCKQTLRTARQFAQSQQALKFVETEYVDVLMKTADAKEGILAFMEKRQPVWSQSP